MYSIAKEERLMKVLAGLLISCRDLNVEKLGGVLRSDINSGIINLNFSAHNLYQMGKDLEILISKGFVNKLEDESSTRYRITNGGADVAKSIIQVWDAIRGS